MGSVLPPESRILIDMSPRREWRVGEVVAFVGGDQVVVHRVVHRGRDYVLYPRRCPPGAGHASQAGADPRTGECDGVPAVDGFHCHPQSPRTAARARRRGRSPAASQVASSLLSDRHHRRDHAHVPRARGPRAPRGRAPARQDPDEGRLPSPASETTAVGSRLPRIACRWHRGKATRHQASRLDVIALHDTRDGPFVESTPDSLTLVHGAPRSGRWRNSRRPAGVSRPLYWDAPRCGPAAIPWSRFRSSNRIAEGGALVRQRDPRPISDWVSITASCGALAARAAFAPLDEETGWSGILRVLPGSPRSSLIPAATGRFDILGPLRPADSNLSRHACGRPCGAA
jgi:hypothetical protein